MTDHAAQFDGPVQTLRGLGAVMLRQFWLIALVVTVGALSSLGYGRMQAPGYEASAVIQVRAGVDLTGATERLLSRENLTALALRHNLTGTARSRAAVLLRQAVSVRSLTTEAGATLGFVPETVGLVVSVLLPDAQAAARVANDLAQQILDQGLAGNLQANEEDLDFYRREELRLWQEVSALQTELQGEVTLSSPEVDRAALNNERQLTLLRDQYAAVRARLAGFEVDARLAAKTQAGQFSLLQRATSSEAVSVVQDWMLIGVAGSLLLAVTLAFVLERRYPALQHATQEGQATVRSVFARGYRVFDDPARPVLGLPRFAVVTLLVVTWMIGIAAMLR